MTTTVEPKRLRYVLSSISSATTSQLLSAASNLVITLAVARGTGLEGLGRFSIAFTAYLTALGFARSLITEPLLAKPPRPDDENVESSALTLTLVFACGAACIVGCIGLLLERPELLLAGCALPIVLLHDALRYLAFRRQRPLLAVVLDAGWFAGSCAMWPIVVTFGSVGVSVVCWAASALVGVTLVLHTLRPRPARLKTSFRWWRRDACSLAAPLTIESLLVTLSLQATIVAIAYAAGDAALGLLRAGQVFFAPLTILFTAIGILTVPYLAQRTAPPQNKVAYQLSAALALLASVMSALIIATARFLHDLLFTDQIAVAQTILVPLAVQIVLGAAAGGGVVLLKVRSNAGDIARSRTFSTIAGLLLIVPITLQFGLMGALWAMTVPAFLHLAGLLACVARRSPVTLAVER